MITSQRRPKQSDLSTAHTHYDFRSGVDAHRNQTIAHNDRLELLMEAARVQRLVTLRQFAAEDWFIHSLERELAPYRTKYMRAGASYGESDPAMVQWFNACANHPMLYLHSPLGSDDETCSDAA